MPVRKAYPLRISSLALLMRNPGLIGRFHSVSAGFARIPVRKDSPMRISSFSLLMYNPGLAYSHRKINAKRLYHYFVQLRCGGRKNITYTEGLKKSRLIPESPDGFSGISLRIPAARFLIPREPASGSM